MNLKKRKSFIFFYFPLFTLYSLFSISNVLAAPNISSDVFEHWAWNDIIGWIDFYSTNNVNVAISKIEGYADSSAGSIAFDCATSPNGNICGASNFEVSNDGAGNLSGFAWSESIGWISFYCGDLDLVPPICDQFNYRVTIDGAGNFSGWAWNDSVGWISFNCNNSGIGDTCAVSNYKVKTSWTAISVSGNLISSVFDTGYAGGVAFNSLAWKGSQPAGANVKFQFASANQASGIGGAGPIDGTYRYAWDDSTGWWDFGYCAGNVNVRSTQLTGYAYNTNLYEISLDCATSPAGNVCGTPPYKVSRDSTTGDLAGWAWNDSIGWISFCGNSSSGSTWDGSKWVCPASPTYQVKVNPTTGVFTGWAWNDDIGWVSFNCADTGLDCGGTTTNYYVATVQSGSFPEPIGPNGTSFPTDTYNPTGPGAPIALKRQYHNNHRYFRYKIILESDYAQTVSPRVDDVIVNWSP